jgi:hypothetical protein
MSIDKKVNLIFGLVIAWFFAIFAIIICLGYVGYKVLQHIGIL